MDDERKFIEAMVQVKGLSKEICEHAEKIQSLLSQINRLWEAEEEEEEAAERGAASPLGGKAKES